MARITHSVDDNECESRGPRLVPVLNEISFSSSDDGTLALNPPLARDRFREGGRFHRGIKSPLCPYKRSTRDDPGRARRIGRAGAHALAIYRWEIACVLARRPRVEPPRSRGSVSPSG